VFGLFAPDPDALTTVFIPAGTSWWIMDARDGYYQLWITCEGTPLWVSTEFVIPNYDDVWHGAPLPNSGG